MAAASNRSRILAVVAILVLCVIGIGTLRIAQGSDRGKQEGGEDKDRPVRYVDPTYGFS